MFPKKRGTSRIVKRKTLVMAKLSKRDNRREETNRKHQRIINFALSEAGALPSSWLYRNDFSDNGRRLTFTVNSDRAHEKALVDFFVEHGQSSENRKALLFARTSTQTKFMYCGVLAGEICEREDTESDDDENYVNLVLELMEYDNLIANGPTGEPSAFMEIVSSHTAALAMERELFAES